MEDYLLMLLHLEPKNTIKLCKELDEKKLKMIF